jgi:hypothetical protein
VLRKIKEVISARTANIGDERLETGSHYTKLFKIPSTEFFKGKHPVTQH